MNDKIERIQKELQAGTDGAKRDVRIQLDSVNEGLEEMFEGEKTQEAHVHADRLAELIATLDGLEEKAEGGTRTHIVEARTLLGDYIKEEQPE